MASTQDAWYISLLGLAEHFRTSNPPDIKSCIQCLQAVFNFKPPQRVEARTHLQLGNILLTHTKNIDLARTHLEQSVSFFYCYLSISVWKIRIGLSAFSVTSGGSYLCGFGVGMMQKTFPKYVNNEDEVGHMANKQCYGCSGVSHRRSTASMT